MTVIGFVTYEDFRNEIRDAGVEVVRMQDYYRRHRNDVGMTWLRFFVELAAANGTEIYVARFQIGEVLNMPGKEQEIEEVRERTRQLMDFLRRDLEALGVRVRPGLVAPASEAQVITTAPQDEAHHAQP